jgi:thioredoxin:protein disulfide reductase
MTFGETWVYREDITVTLPPQEGVLTVRWQGCQDGGICYPPQTAEITLGGTNAGGTMPAEGRSGEWRNGAGR